MKIVKVEGTNNKHKVFMYAISTCAWCKKAKKFLKDYNIEFEYVDVDLCTQEDKEKIREDIERRGGRPSYPILIIDDKHLIIGFHEDKIREALQF